jgi:plastocyanin
MSNETLFYICGIAAAVSAVGVSFLGLKIKSFPGRAMPVVVLWFVLLVGAATTFSVLNAKDEEKAKAAEFAEANQEIESEENEAPAAEGGGEAEEKPEGAEAGGGAKGPGGTLQLAADPSALAYDEAGLTSKPGKVTIDFENPAPIEHDVVIAKDGKEIAGSELIAEGKTSVSADLTPGAYIFFCSVPGHAAAGMEGILTVK